MNVLLDYFLDSLLEQLISVAITHGVHRAKQATEDKTNRSLISRDIDERAKLPPPKHCLLDALRE